MKNLIFIIALIFVASPVLAKDDISVYLGGWSKHLGKTNTTELDGVPLKELNENHGLIAISYNKLTVAKFENTYYRESYFIGLNFDVYENDYLESKVSVGGVYGYDKCPPTKGGRIVYPESESIWCPALFGEITPKINFPIKPALLMFGTVPAISFKFEF